MQSFYKNPIVTQIPHNCVSDKAQRYRAQVIDPTSWVCFAAGADRIGHINREADNSKSASSLRSLSQLLLNIQFKIVYHNLKMKGL